MGRALAVLPTTVLLILIAAPSPLLAKGEIFKITIKSADLASSIEITDPKLVKDFTVYSGPGFRDANGQGQTPNRRVHHRLVPGPRGGVPKGTPAL